MNYPSLRELLPSEDYRFQLRLTQGAPAEFFAPTAEHTAIAAERSALLATSPARYAALEPEAEPMLAEAIELANAWATLTPEESRRIADANTAGERCLVLGAVWEPDFLLLKADAAGALRLRGGCVCFPSSWALEDKMSKTLAEIHGVVPGLNAAIGTPIETFLKRLRSGVAFHRSNWGLARCSNLNLHPALGRPRLASPLAIADVWLRVEHQALVALPKSGGILFGIRIRLHPLTEVKADVEAARGLRHALASMPEAMAEYKGLATVRHELVRLLET